MKKKPAVVKSAELREAAALKVAQAGSISRKELHLMNREFQKGIAQRQLNQDREFKDRELAIADRRLQEEKFAQAQLDQQLAIVHYRLRAQSSSR
jgi:hypothetical protein